MPYLEMPRTSLLRLSVSMCRPGLMRSGFLVVATLFLTGCGSQGKGEIRIKEEIQKHSSTAGVQRVETPPASSNPAISSTNGNCWEGRPLNNTKKSGEIKFMPLEELRKYRVTHTRLSIKACIDEKGQVQQAFAVESTGAIEVDKWYLGQVLGLMYAPYKVGGNEMPSYTLVVVKFHPTR